MPPHDTHHLSAHSVLQLLRDHARLWVAPAVAGLVLTAAAAWMTPRKWKATQGMIVRSEAAGYADQRLGKFTDLSEMKTVQATVLELARSRAVLTAALNDVGPPRRLFKSTRWPTPEDVQQLREDLSVAPPGGAEFGATEVFYLTALDESPARAVAIVDAVSRHLDARLRRLRNAQAESMVDELDDAVTTARGRLQRSIDELAELEGAVGPDLAELRSLVSPIGGHGALTEKSMAIQSELRANAENQRRGRALLQTLKAALSDPDALVATPSALLTSQPAIERLKAGLVDAQLRTARLRGTRTPHHPVVRAAIESETRHREQLRRELPAAIDGVELELALYRQRDAALRADLHATRQRRGELAARRAEYSMRLASVENQRQVVDAAEAQLADGRARAAGSNSASILARVDTAEAGIRPVGPGRAVVSLAGGLGGLILGVGLVFTLHVPRPAAEPEPGFAAEPTPGVWTEQFPSPPGATTVWADAPSAPVAIPTPAG